MWWLLVQTDSENNKESCFLFLPPVWLKRDQFFFPPSLWFDSIRFDLFFFFDSKPKRKTFATIWRMSFETIWPDEIKLWTNCGHPASIIKDWFWSVAKEGTKNQKIISVSVFLFDQKEKKKKKRKRDGMKTDNEKTSGPQSWRDWKWLEDTTFDLRMEKSKVFQWDFWWP